MDRLHAFVLVHHLILIECTRVERARRKARMARDLQSLEQALGLFESNMDAEAGKVFDAIDVVNAKAPGVFQRTHARVAAKAATVDRVDKLLTSLDRANQNPTSGGSSNGSATSSDAKTEPPAEPLAESAEKKT